MKRIPTSNIKYKSLKRVDKTNALDSIVESINSRSNADFIKRLLDPNRKVIKNDDSHVSSNNEAIEQYGQGFLYPSISIETKPSVVIDTEPKYDYNEIKRRQRYIESRFNDKAVSPAGAIGAYQIMPITLKDYTMRTGETGDLTNYSFNEKIRDFYMNRYLNSEWATKNGQSEYNRIAKALAAYNWGAGNLLKYLEKQKTAGKDIYTATDWIAGLPKETRDYIKWILDGEDLYGRITNALYKRAKARVRIHQGGGILKTKGRRLYGPGGSMNLTPYIQKVIAKGYSTLRDVLSGDPEKQKKVVEKYHENADKMPVWTHRVVYNTLKDTAFSGNMEDIPINFIHNAFSSRPNIDNTFLLDPERQKQELEKLGFRRVDTSKGYGLVDSAVKKYKNATGREVPMYQIGEDDELRENLIPLNNKYLYNAAENYREVIDKVDPETGMINALHREYLGPGMGDKASVPTRYYRDTAGNLYVKEWDFFDHGNYSRRNFNSDEQTYVTKALNTMSNAYGNLMDIAGNPFVRTTGYTRIHPDALKTAIKYIVGVDDYYNRFKGNSKEVLNAIKNGEFDIKARGGKIHIKPENRGKFTALKERTGHSASWFKENGTPAQKKMAVFDLNSRKWTRKEDGGVIDRGNSNGFYNMPVPINRSYEDFNDYWYSNRLGLLGQNLVDSGVKSVELPVYNRRYVGELPVSLMNIGNEEYNRIMANQNTAPVSYVNNTGGGPLGAYSPWDHSIEIRASLPGDDKKSTYVHEKNHAGLMTAQKKLIDRYKDEHPDYTDLELPGEPGRSVYNYLNDSDEILSRRQQFLYDVGANPTFFNIPDAVYDYLEYNKLVEKYGDPFIDRGIIYSPEEGSPFYNYNKRAVPELKGKDKLIFDALQKHNLSRYSKNFLEYIIKGVAQVGKTDNKNIIANGSDINRGRLDSIVNAANGGRLYRLGGYKQGGILKRK